MIIYVKISKLLDFIGYIRIGFLCFFISVVFGMKYN